MSYPYESDIGWFQKLNLERKKKKGKKRKREKKIICRKWLKK